jgi:CheY-like chemotaxis protein
MVSLKGLRILFADDETYNMRGTIDALEFAGAKVYVVTDGTEALEFLREHKTDLPDLLILDIMMPGGPEIQPIEPRDEGRSTGVKVHRRMQEENITIPTVVSTVVSDESILDYFRRDQKIPIVQKPYRFAELEHQIMKVLTESERR